MEISKRCRIIFRFISLSSLSILVGCAGTTKTIIPITGTISPGGLTAYQIGSITAKTPSANSEFISLVKGHLEEELKNRHMFADGQNANPGVIDVEITDYRMRSVMARTFFGVLAGPDRVGSTITIHSNNGNQVMGKAEISSAALLAPMNFWDALAAKHAREIIGYLAGIKK